MEPPNPSRLRTIAISLVIFAVATGAMAYLRLHVFREQLIVLTYGLPLLVCLWRRDRVLLWSMAVAFMAMAAYKAFVLMPPRDASDVSAIWQWLMQVANILIPAVAVHAIINYTNRLHLKQAKLKQLNAELEQRAEEITRQKDELESQQEELAQQNEEIQSQSEEVAQQNEELQNQAEELENQAEQLQGANEELNQREELLQTLIDSVHKDSSDQELLDKICASTLKLFGKTAHAAAVVEREGDDLVVRAHAGISELNFHRWPFRDSFAALVMQEGRTGFIKDIERRPEIILPRPKGHQFASIMATPVRIGGKASGAVEVYSRTPRAWTRQDFLVVEWVAAQSALILESRQLASQRRQAELSLAGQNERLRLLSQALTFLLSAKDNKDVAAELFSRVAKHLGLDTYFNFLVDETEHNLKLNSCAGVPEAAAPCVQCLDFGQAICGQVALERKPVIAEHIQQTQDPRADLVRSFGIRAYACNPLLSGERLIGTLSFGSRERDQFSPDELEFMRTISQYVSIAMERLRTEKQLQAAKEELEAEVERRTARLRDAVAELEHFSYTITHDMRAPLRSMTGFAELLLEDTDANLTPENREYLRKIMRSAVRMDGLIRDALNYSKIVREQMPLTSIDTGALLNDIIQSYPDFQPPKADIQITGQLPSVVGNQAGLTQCFSNLLSNAVKFVRPGEVPRIQIWAEASNGTARLWFEDNGIGIKPEFRGRVFEMFQRLNRDYEGTGIGLALVRKAAERMGGKVGFESEFGKGTRFWLELKNG